MKLDHVAVTVDNIENGVQWYMSRFDLEILYQDDSWAMLKVSEPDIKIALVIESQHPNHIGISCDSLPPFAKEGTFHRDGSEYHYDTDPWGNTWEWVKYPEEKS